ncbi:MAG: hypothetical protein ACFB50_04980 [Rubrobacteraceae bacterium]
MKRATITLSDELEKVLEDYQRSQDVPVPLTAVTQAALREYLAKRGFPTTPEKRSFKITPARKGSAEKDVSSEHDRYFAEAAEE